MLPFKLLVLPLLLVCMTATALVKLLTNLSSYIFGPLMLFLLGFCVCFIVQQTWNQVAILAVLEILCVVTLFGAVYIETLLDNVCSALTFFYIPDTGAACGRPLFFEGMVIEWQQPD